jgi:cytochrome c oxidase cbb3-type subunit 3
MLTQPANIFVIVFTVINIAACGWLMWWTSRRQAPKPGAVGETVEKTGHVWDGDLEEFNNPLPRWWLGLFIITIVLGAGYLAFYPGLGNYSGLRGWTQVEQHEKRAAAARAQLEERLAAFKDKPLHELARDPGAMATAKNLFGASCSTCHGSDARGAKGFPNLADADWLWGGGEEAVYQTIAQGRIGAMPALGDALGATGVNEVAAYVVSLSGGNAPADWVSAGKTRFETLCVACHGADAKGNVLLGAPNLSDKVWLHGGDFDTVRATVAKGRTNQMPAHLEMLGAAKVRLLAAYVLSLSQPSDADRQTVNRLTGQPAREERFEERSEKLLPVASASVPVGQLATRRPARSGGEGVDGT